jgi:hypothetical protein
MRIKLIKAPGGRAQTDMRERWIGLILPVIRQVPDCAACSDKDFDVSTADQAYLVGIEDVLELLKRHDSVAFEYWKDYLLRNFAGTMAFSSKICQVLPD